MSEELKKTEKAGKNEELRRAEENS